MRLLGGSKLRQGVAVASTAMFAVFFSSLASGCGIHWSVPVTHYAGVDERGHVCYSEQIGEIDLQEGLKLPLIINFRSDRESSSSTLGKGWILALLDSNFVQTAENAFQMTQPDGWVRPFYRGKSSDTVLDGGPAWKGEVKGDVVTVWAGCGWKFVYRRGKIASFTTPQNKTLSYLYSEAGVQEIQETGGAVLTVERDAKGKSKALLFGGQRLDIEQDARPAVQQIGGQNIVSGVDQSLKRLVGKGSNSVFEFAVNEKVLPTLSITTSGSSRVMVWDPAGKQVISDGAWRYKIKMGKAPFDAAVMERVNADNQSELWETDPQKGIEVIKTPDGSVYTTTRFVSGLLAGATRAVRLENSEGTSEWKRQYDEKGRLIRVTEQTPGAPVSHVVEEYTFHPNGYRARVRKGEMIMDFDPQGRMIETRQGDQILWHITYDGSRAQPVYQQTLTF